MKLFTSFIFLILFCFGTILGQSKTIAYKVPSEYFSLLLVEDKNCPIQLLDPVVLGFGKGRFSKTYSLRNRSEKNINSFVLNVISWYGDEESTGYPEVAKKDLPFSPNEIFSTFPDLSEITIAPFDETKADELDISKSNKKVFVIMVSEVNFSDGTSYSVKNKLDLIRNFITNIEFKSDRSEKETQQLEEKFRSFVTKTMKSSPPTILD